ncbi:MAG: hypothetical protein ABWY02_01255 [Telluria sp.]
MRGSTQVCAHTLRERVRGACINIVHAAVVEPHGEPVIEAIGLKDSYRLLVDPGSAPAAHPSELNWFKKQYPCRLAAHAFSTVNQLKPYAF